MISLSHVDEYAPAHFKEDGAQAQAIKPWYIVDHGGGGPWGEGQGPEAVQHSCDSSHIPAAEQLQCVPRNNCYYGSFHSKCCSTVINHRHMRQRGDYSNCVCVMNLHAAKGVYTTRWLYRLALR